MIEKGSRHNPNHNGDHRIVTFDTLTRRELYNVLRYIAEHHPEMLYEYGLTPDNVRKGKFAHADRFVLLVIAPHLFREGFSPELYPEDEDDFLPMGSERSA